MGVQYNNPLIIVDTATLILKDKAGNPILDFEGKEQLDEKAWLKEREQGRDIKTLGIDVPFQIGGSSASTIMGLNPWVSKTAYYNEKLGLIKKNKKQNSDALQSGHTFEDAIRRRFCELMIEDGYRVKLVNDTNMYRCNHRDEDGNLLYPFMIGDCDGIISVNGKVGILEIKTTDDWGVIKDYWEKGICPPYYEMQVRHYMCVMNLPYAYICCAWGVRANKIAIIRIERDMDKEKLLCEAEADFIQHLINKEEPDEREDNQKKLREFYEDKYDEVFPEQKSAFEIPDEYDLDIREYLDAKEELDKLKKKEKVYTDIMQEVENKMVKLFCDDKLQYGQYDLDDKHKVFVNVKQTLKRTTYDLEKIKVEQPELWDKGKTISFAKSNLAKSEQKIIEDYALPREVSSRKFSLKVVDSTQAPIKK